jgi:hypothetical protein
MGRWRVHRWTLLAGNGQSQMLCQFDHDLLGGLIEVCDAKATNLPRAAGQEFNTRVRGWFTSHDRGYSIAPPRS